MSTTRKRLALWPIHSGKANKEDDSPKTPYTYVGLESLHAPQEYADPNLQDLALTYFPLLFQAHVQCFQAFWVIEYAVPAI